MQFLFALPELAFRNEDIASLGSNEDIGFPLKVECFTGRLAFILRVELHKKVGSEVFLSHVLKGVRALLHDADHVLNDGKDILVLICRKNGSGANLPVGTAGRSTRARPRCMGTA